MPASAPDTPDYQMFPRVVPEGWSGTLTARGEYAHTKLVPGVKYRYELASMRWHADAKRRRGPLTGTVEADPRGQLAIPAAPDVGGEWVLTVTSEDRRVRTLPMLGFFVIGREFRKLRPYIGDLHAHSTGSDGRQEPAYCGMRARELGFDFFALTDHNNYHSSEEMIRKVRGKLGRKMLLMKGEELHASPAPFHHVGVGHSESVEDFRSTNKAQYRREVRKIIRELTKRETVEHLDVKAYAEGLWKLRKARELGGLTIYAHPYWSYQGSLCLDEADREQTFLDNEFDAVEVTTSADHTDFMANRIAQEAAGGRRLSVVGISDSHHWGESGISGDYWTYVLAGELTQEGVFGAIRQGRSMACRNIGGHLQLVGPFELMEFADFYHRRLLPLKKRLMKLEAALALSALRGGAYERKVVEKLDRELERLERRSWA